MPLNRNHGITLIELMLAVAIMSMVMLAVYPLFRQSHMMTSRSDVRNRTMTEVRVGLELMINVLEHGKAGSWTLSSPDFLRPYSRVDFVRAENDMPQAFYWENRCVYFKDGNQDAKVLFSNVQFLTFTGERADPGILRISFRIDAPIAGTTPYSIFIANREVHLRD